jgi:hypothetical protein
MLVTLDVFFSNTCKVACLICDATALLHFYPHYRPSSWTTQDPAWQPEEDSSESQPGLVIPLTGMPRVLDP